MRVAAITITYNRLELTKRTLASFNEKTGVDYHLFVDNGSTDGTVEWLEDKNRILFSENRGITEAFFSGAANLLDYDYILKLDNDVETVTKDVVDKIVRFIERNGAHAVSPVDLLIDPAYYPSVIREETVDGLRVQYTSHTGGAFQIAPTWIIKMLMEDYNHFKCGDQMIGKFYRRHKCPPCYIRDYQMKHIGLNQTSDGYIL